MGESSADTFRWQSFFQHSTQPIIVLNRRRRVLFVNRAWEACTGLPLAEVRGRACRRRSSIQEADERVLRVFAPPADAMKGETCRVRRRAPGGADWWEIQFVPLAGPDDLLGILGTMRVFSAPKETPFALPEQLMALRDQQARRYRLEDLDHSQPAMQKLLGQARLAASTSVPITLVGEAGSGKQWLARAIHQSSERRHRYFIALDAERLPAAAIGEIVFGPRSRILALGTLYLREPGCWPREWQGRLVDAVYQSEAGEFPRLIIGCRREPRDEVQSGRLLDELASAAGMLTLQIPPLRNRLAEMPGLINTFLQRQRDWQPHTLQGVAPEALNALRNAPWPGNLQELQDVLRSACLRAKGERIELADLPFYLKNTALPPDRRLPLDKLLEQVERRLIALAMKVTQGNHTRAAELLEIWRPRLIRRLEKFAAEESP